jgi:hypothetical protein
MHTLLRRVRRLDQSRVPQLPRSSFNSAFNATTLPFASKPAAASMRPARPCDAEIMSSLRVAIRPEADLGGQDALALCLSSRHLHFAAYRAPHYIAKMQRISEILQFPVIVERRRPPSLSLNRFRNSISSCVTVPAE